MKPRAELIFGLALGLLAVSLAVEAQQVKVHPIGILTGDKREAP